MSATPSTRPPIPHLRWWIAGLLCLSSALNYLDRQTLSVLSKTIQDALSLSKQDYSLITTAFLVSYTIMYAVSGRLVDAIGTRRSFLVFVSAWSLANMLHAAARTTARFAFFRFLLGAAEPANFPAGVKAVSEWFPLRERALAIGIFNAGTAAGSALAAPIVSVIALHWGWQSAFVVTGGLGFVWVAAWALLYRVPEEHPRLGEEERRLILADRAAEAAGGTASWGEVLRQRAAWGCIAARVLTDPISFFLIFWVPQYLQEERGFSLADLGAYAWIPYVVAAFGNVAGGAVPRLLIGRGWPLDRARKTVMLAASCAMPVLCLSVTRVGSPAVALALISGIYFAHGAWANITLPAEVFPKQMVGTVSGLAGCAGALASALTQRFIGAQVSFGPVFAACSVLHLTALAAVQVLIGRLGVIRPIGSARPEPSA